jgi:arabinogalactan endo-1,4-beta-galactosidase
MKKMVLLLMILSSCSNLTEKPVDYGYLSYYDAQFDPSQLAHPKRLPHRDDFIRGVDVSTYEEVIAKGGEFFNEYGESEHLFSIFKRAGINLIRIRLWNDPVNFHPWNGGYLDLQTVTRIATIAKSYGMKWLLDFHYSDTWADPGNQTKPNAWKDLSFANLVNALGDYTFATMTHFINLGLTPDYVQIGNEINNGMLWNDGKIYQNNQTNFTPLIQLLKAGVAAVRSTSLTTKIIIHLASSEDQVQFYNFFLTILSAGVDLDIIAGSYYSYWNGSLLEVKENFNQLSIQFEKDILLVETAQAFTLKPNPNGINIYGPTQNLASGYPATIAGQSQLVYDALAMMTDIAGGRGLGMVYWEPAWIPIQGENNFTSWANQTFFTYEGQVIPSLFTFNDVK